MPEVRQRRPVRNRQAEPLPRLTPGHHGQEIEPASLNRSARERRLDRANRWQSLAEWPSACASGCAPKATPLYLEADSKSPSRPRSLAARHSKSTSPTRPNQFLSHSAQPAPSATRRTSPGCAGVVDDQREFSGRTDVVSFTSDALAAPLRISGEPIVHLVAPTSATDSDWVVKVIDIYPDVIPFHPDLGGYQLPPTMDIFRSRDRKSLSHVKPLTPKQPLGYQFLLPTANHLFLTGDRIMVQIQSSWFPLYDRNPQTPEGNSATEHQTGRLCTEPP